MQLHRKADNSCSQIWGVCVRWFSTRNIAGLKRGNLGGFRNIIAKETFGSLPAIMRFYVYKTEL